MGAHSFQLTIKADNESKFKELLEYEVEEDRIENGSGPYSGSIGQKVDGYRLVSRKPVTESKCAKLRELHEGDKWDRFAMACPVVQMEVFGRAKSFTKTVEVVPSYNTVWSAKREAFKQVPVTDFEIIGEVTVTKVSDAVYKVAKSEKVQPGWKVHFNGRPVGSVFESQSEALKHAKEKTLETGQYAEVIKHIGAYQRVLKKHARYKVSFKWKETRPTDKISHFEVWGWAAD